MNILHSVFEYYIHHGPGITLIDSDGIRHKITSSIRRSSNIMDEVILELYVGDTVAGQLYVESGYFIQSADYRNSLIDYSVFS